MQLKGVILDVDGTLVDSNNAHAWAWVEAFERHGLGVSFEQVRPLIGMGADHLVPSLAPVSEEEQKALGEEQSRIFRQKYLHRLRAFPKTRELLQRLRSDGLRLVVASSAKEEVLGPLLDIAGASDLLDSSTGADGKNSKPEPDIVAAALDELKLSPQQVVMLGDTPYDIEAAGKVGVKVIALRCGGFSEQDLSQAVAIYQDPEDLLNHLGQSVFRPAQAARRI